MTAFAAVPWQATAIKRALNESRLVWRPALQAKFLGPAPVGEITAAPPEHVAISVFARQRAGRRLEKNANPSHRRDEIYGGLHATEGAQMNVPPTGHRIERLPAVCARTGLGRSSLYALMAQGRFVRPIKLSARAIGFIAGEVDEWIAARAAERGPARQT